MSPFFKGQLQYISLHVFHYGWIVLAIYDPVLCFKLQYAG